MVTPQAAAMHPATISDMRNLWLQTARDGLIRTTAITRVFSDGDNLIVTTRETSGGGRGDTWEVDPANYIVCRVADLDQEEDRLSLPARLVEALGVSTVRSGIITVDDGRLRVIPFD
ncbi:hypothetical protein [Saccharopolyspora griseoalba]|uniref:Uncharacterized protein n=1 Tax=Saccharopolyspora griseoalba TaxID=1431848 RepID=A0ABW2LV66_9PSEU